MLCCFCMIQYEGNRTLVTVSLENLNKVFSNYPETKITISRKWADKYNSAMSLAAGMPIPEVERKVKVQTEKVETKTNETNDNEEVITYKTIN